MAREYFPAYHSYLESMEELTDAEKGRLFTACLIYSKTGEAPQLSGNERYVFPTFRSQIDRDNAEYAKRCATNKKNGELGGNRTVANGTERGHSVPIAPKGKEKEKGKGKGECKGKGEDILPLPSLTGVSVELLDAFSLWLDYKAERKETYAPIGLQQLITRIQNSAAQYGDHAVAELIKNCMAAGWKGIIFDRLKANHAQEPAKRKESWAELAERLDREEIT